MSGFENREPPPPSIVREPERRAVSIELGLQRCLGKRELYERIAGRFIAERRNAPDAIAAALHARDSELAYGLAHSLISTAGTIGASTLSETALKLELAIEAGDAPSWPALLRELQEEHRAVEEELRRYLSGAAGRGEGQAPAVPEADGGHAGRTR